MVMLKIDHLKKQYGAFTLDCSLEVPPGRITGLVGQNGAGKSTTFKAVLGLIFPEGGSIRVLGRDIRTLTREDRQKLGVVLSDSGFSGYLNIKDLASIQKNLYETFDAPAFLARAEAFGLPAGKQIKTFSTGMKAKLKVLCALSHQAKLLLLDEPTAGLDVIARDFVLNLLREYMEEDEERSILISSHISGDLESLCDDVYLIHKGTILLHEDTDRFLSHYGVFTADPALYASLDKEHLLRVKKESYGYRCLTDQRAFYAENYPQAVIEKGSIDEVITMMIQGETI